MSKLLASIICLPGVLVAKKLRELSKGSTPSDPMLHSQAGDGNAHIPLLTRAAFLFIEKRNREHLIGDLDEEYCTVIIPVRSGFQARHWWWREAVGIVTAYLWKRATRRLRLANILRLL